MTPELQKITDWILERHSDMTEIDLDADLIENRLIDSLAFVEFVFLIEQVSGKPVNTDTLEVDDLRSLRRISENFLDSGPA